MPSDWTEIMLPNSFLSWATYRPADPHAQEWRSLRRGIQCVSFSLALEFALTGMDGPAIVGADGGRSAIGSWSRNAIGNGNGMATVVRL